MKLLYVLLFVLFVFTGPQLEAHDEPDSKGSFPEESLTVATYDIPGLMNYQGDEKDPGFLLHHFREIFRKAEENLGREIRFIHLPPKRSLKSFLDKDKFALLPAFEWQIPQKEFLRSDPVGYKVDVIFFLKGANPKKILSRKNYKMGVVRDYPYPPASLRKHKGNLVYFENMLAGVKMLRAGRVQLLLGDSPTTFETFLRLGVTDVEFSEDLANSSSPAYLYVRNSPHGKAFLKILNLEYKNKNLRKKFLNHTLRIKEKYLRSKEAVKNTENPK